MGWLQGQSELAGYRWVTLVGWLQIGYTGGLASLRVGWLGYTDGLATVAH